MLGIKLPWLDEIGRPSQKRRIPSVLTKGEVAGLLAHMVGVTAVIVNANVFDVLMQAERVCSLGQITYALFEMGEQYRRNM